jgi:hypothetical protein
MRRRSPWPVLLAACGACGGGPGCGAAEGPVPPRSSPRVAETCAIRLPPRTIASPLPGTPPSPFVAPRSTLVVHAEVPLAGVRAALEAKVPRRVAEERNRDIGLAGRLEYTVDRGPFTVRVDNDVLVVESPLVGSARACAKGRCYAGCAPEARVTARVPFRLSADYKLRTSEVRIDVTRGCEVHALGGLVTIDVTPMLRNALAGQSRNVQASIDRELPDFAPQAQRLWAELVQSRSLPLGMCMTLAPEAITQGPASGTAELAKLRFGLHARPEVRVKCAPLASGGGGAAGAPSTLPPLRDDPALPAVGDVFLGIVLPEDAAARAMERSDAIDLGRARARVKQASGDLTSGLVLDLAGEACGEVGISIGGVAFRDPQFVTLTGAAPMGGERERLTAAGLDAGRLVEEAQKAPIALPIAVSALESMLPEIAKGIADEHVTIGVTVESSKPETAGLRGPEIVAVARVRGAVAVALRMK